MNESKKLINESQNKNNKPLNQEIEKFNSCLIYEGLEPENGFDDEQEKDLLEGVEKIAKKESAITEPNEKENENGSTKDTNKKDQNKKSSNSKVNKIEENKAIKIIFENEKLEDIKSEEKKSGVKTSSIKKDEYEVNEKKLEKTFSEKILNEKLNIAKNEKFDINEDAKSMSL